jgi:glutamate formiminotransferase
MNGWVECIPNVSEGRDGSVVEGIRQAIVSVRDIHLLDWSMDADHNRSVFTFAGPPDSVAQAVLLAASAAVESIDLRKHHGAHPRIGAIDVIPFVPLEGASTTDCVRLARGVATALWNRLHVPAYFYGDAALRDDRRRLENVRRGGFERLRQILPADRERWPDVGGPELHPSAGATAVGVRKFLIAYNINLDTLDVSIAKRIAACVRESSGGLPAVKALGLALPSRQLTQVSMNLTDFERTPLRVVFERVTEEAARFGVRIAGSEIIGLVPRKALDEAAAHFLRIEGFRPAMILENRLREAVNGEP